MTHPLLAGCFGDGTTGVPGSSSTCKSVSLTDVFKRHLFGLGMDNLAFGGGQVTIHCTVDHGAVRGAKVRLMWENAFVGDTCLSGKSSERMAGTYAGGAPPLCAGTQPIVSTPTAVAIPSTGVPRSHCGIFFG